jgi:diguanylate cyclase (GGDEF)-like protein
MVAGREPISLILEEIAGAIARTYPGTVCAIAGDWDEMPGAGKTFCCTSPGTFEQLDEVVARQEIPRNPAEWRDCIRSSSGDRFRDELLVQPISDGLAIALLLPRESAVPEAASQVLETFAGLAAGALENHRLYRQLAHQANYDKLTGLPNRACFEEELARLVESAAPGTEFAVLYLDLDRFKQINDTLGHRIGDLFLKHVASRLSGALNEEERLFRIGGDEFIVLARGGRDPIGTLAAKLLACLDGPAAIADNELFASASIGVSFFPEDGDSPLVLQKNADIAMYRAKAKGRNGFELFSPEMNGETGAAHTMERVLRRALAEDGFRLFYQPQFTPSGRIAGFEALLRLIHPDRGMVEAKEFLRIAEESGLIVPIGQWVLREICRQMSEWRCDGFREIRISVNVSPQELSRPSYASEVESQLAETRVPARLVQIELTESTLMANLKECRRQMKRLHTLGVRLTIDDFGAGYSSLSHLQDLRVDTLKIDLAFISGSVGPQAKLPVLPAIVALGRSLDLSLTADGIRTKEDLAAVTPLLDEQRDCVQGPWLGPPLDALTARALLEPAMPGLRYLAGAVEQTEDSLSTASAHSAPVTS